MTDAESAYLQMQLVYDQFARDSFNSPKGLSGKTSVKAIHYIQSFSPDNNITPELAHKIAKAIVVKDFGSDVQAVIATHLDKDHIHSHIIINSYSLSGKKFYADKRSLQIFRRYSDGICKAFGIEIHPHLTGKGRSVQYNEWQHRRNGTSWKEKIRQAIDELIPTVNSLDDLVQTLEEHGYEVKRGKYISIKAPVQKRFVRTKTLGEEYTEESLKVRILYHDIDAGKAIVRDKRSKLRDAYSAIIGDVRILVEQHSKVPRKRVVTDEYSAENDLDVYKLSAQLSVINQNNIGSIGELEGEINRLNEFCKKQRHEINEIIDAYNAMVSLQEQAQEFDALSNKTELSETEKLRKAVCKQAMERNGILNSSDVDALEKRKQILYRKIEKMEKALEKISQQYYVYCDIRETYNEMSRGDYISRLVEEERERQERKKKNKRSMKR